MKQYFFTRGYFAGAGGYALQSGDLVLNQIRRMSGEIIPQDPLTPADIPLIKGFTVRDPIGPSAESVQKFYTNASEITNAANTVKFLINNKNFIEAKKIRNQFPQIKYRSLSDKIIRELSEKRKQREEIRNRILPPHLKKRLYKNIDEEIIKKTRKFNSLIKRSK